MSKNIEGIPESISREAFTAVYRSLGIDPSVVTDLVFRPDGISVSLLARGADGKYVIDRAKGEAVMHEIYIPVEKRPS